MAARPSFSVLRTAGSLPIRPISRWRARGGGGHQRIDAEFLQRFDNLVHLIGAPHAMARHPFDVVFDDLVPIERRVVVLQRSRDLVDDAGTLGGEEAFQGQRLDALDHDAADHLQAGGLADRVAGDGAAHLQFVDQKWQHCFGVRAGQQQRRFVTGRMDRREDRDVDVARLGAEQLCGFLLAAGRHRIDVEEIRIAGQMRRDRAGGFEARCRGDRGDDDIGALGGISRRGRDAGAHGGAGVLQLGALRVGKQDVPGRDGLQPGVAEPAGDGLTSFAEADEAEAGSVAVRHDI